MILNNFSVAEGKHIIDPLAKNIMSKSAIMLRIDFVLSISAMSACFIKLEIVLTIQYLIISNGPSEGNKAKRLEV